MTKMNDVEFRELLVKRNILIHYDSEELQENVKNLSSPKITLAEIRQRVNEAGVDPQQPTLEEISQIVKEVRQKF